MDKSHVGMEQKLCVVCGQDYDTGAILLDKRLRKSLDQHQLTGKGVCPQHKKLHEEGYIALVEIDPNKSNKPQGKHIKQEDAYRTGNIAHIRREVAKEMFNISEDQLENIMIFTEKAVLDMLNEQIPSDAKPN